MDIHLVFLVPEGLEFVAVKDLELSLSNQDSILKNTRYHWEKKTGLIHLHCTTTIIISNLSDLNHYILNKVNLLCVYNVILIASQSIIPPDSFTENQLTNDFIINQTKLAPWSTVILQDQPPAATVSFRATFKKLKLQHKLSSQEMAGSIGYAFHTLPLFHHWKVKMTDYQYNIMGLWYQQAPNNNNTLTNLSQQSSADPNAVILLLGVEIPLPDQKQRNRLFFGRTSLNPAIAYCLVRLVDPKPGQFILDMCCGTGTIPIEGASLYKNVFWLGAEIRTNTLIDKAQGNLLHSNIKNLDLMLGDGRKMCYRPGVIDSIVSDWPWGLRENSYAQIKAMYPKFMKQMWIALKPFGKAYIVTQGHKLMSYVLNYDWCNSMWHTDQIIPIGIGGLNVYLYILSKQPNPSFVPQDIYNDVYPLS